VTESEIVELRTMPVTLMGSQAPPMHAEVDASCQGSSSMLGLQLERLTASIAQSLDRIDAITEKLRPTAFGTRPPHAGA
jgi:hypothetical protein